MDSSKTQTTTASGPSILSGITGKISWVGVAVTVLIIAVVIVGYMYVARGINNGDWNPLTFIGINGYGSLSALENAPKTVTFKEPVATTKDVKPVVQETMCPTPSMESYMIGDVFNEEAIGANAAKTVMDEQFAQAFAAKQNSMAHNDDTLMRSRDQGTMYLEKPNFTKQDALGDCAGAVGGLTKSNLVNPASSGFSVWEANNGALWGQK